MRKQRAAIRYPGYVISNLPSRASIIPLTRRWIQRVVKLPWPNPDAPKQRVVKPRRYHSQSLRPLLQFTFGSTNLIQMRSREGVLIWDFRCIIWIRTKRVPPLRYSLTIFASRQIFNGQERTTSSTYFVFLSTHDWCPYYHIVLHKNIVIMLLNK